MMQIKWLKMWCGSFLHEDFAHVTLYVHLKKVLSVYALLHNILTVHAVELYDDGLWSV